jgi:peptide/bleomycin uptake transporter
MLKSFFLTWNRAFYAWFFLAVILSMAWYGVEILVYYNSWNRELWDSIQSYDEARFWQLFLGWDWGRFGDMAVLKDDIIPSFLEILVIYVPMSVYGTWQTRRWIFKWREANTHYYLNRWDNCKAKIEGASQRLQEDLMVFGKTLEGLFVGLFSAILVLFAFIPILWRLSEGLPVWNGEIIPGFLVWVALGMSLGGTLISLGLGWWLPKLEYRNQVVEAQFRKKLVLSEDDYAARCVQTLFPMFSSIKRNYYRLFNYYMGFGVWQTAFGLCLGNIAMIVIAPSYFQQLITLGVLSQVLNAFGRVESSMTYFIDRWTTIVDFAAVVLRLREFNKALDEAEGQL